MKTFSIALLCISVQADQLGNIVDLTSGFMSGFGYGNVANDIQTAYQVAEGTYDPQPSEPCGMD